MAAFGRRDRPKRVVYGSSASTIDRGVRGDLGFSGSPIKGHSASVVECPKCGGPTRNVSWEPASAFELRLRTRRVDFVVLLSESAAWTKWRCSAMRSHFIFHPLLQRFAAMSGPNTICGGAPFRTLRLPLNAQFDAQSGLQDQLILLLARIGGSTAQAVPDRGIVAANRNSRLRPIAYHHWSNRANA